MKTWILQCETLSWRKKIDIGWNLLQNSFWIKNTEMEEKRIGLRGNRATQVKHPFLEKRQIDALNITATTEQIVSLIKCYLVDIVILHRFSCFAIFQYSNLDNSEVQNHSATLL